MNRRHTLSLFAGAALMPATPALSRDVSPDDAAAVVAWAQECQAAWAAADAERMYRTAADDLEWINIVGMHWRGKAAVIEAHRIFLTTMFRGVPNTFRGIETIRPLGHDALIAVVRWSVGQFNTPIGTVVPAADDRMTLVFRRTSGGLSLVHGANIQIDAMAEASNPVRTAG
jgi:uncharacterized protein (TIGR02246 family)